VKQYVQQQCQRVMEGTVSLQDFIFAKEYRGMPGYKPGACVPALEIAKYEVLLLSFYDFANKRLAKQLLFLFFLWLCCIQF